MNKYLKQILSGIAKFIIGILVLLLFFWIIIPSTLSLFWGKDIPEINDSDLMLPKVTLADEENMFIDLDRITNDTVYQPKEVNFIKDFLQSDTWDEAFANEVFQKNEEALALWSKAAQKNEFLSPIMANPDEYSIDSPIIAMNGWRSISRVSLARAVWLARIGKNQEATDEAMKSIKIGDAMIKSQNNLIGYVVGLAVKDSALNGLQKIVDITKGKSINKEKVLTELDKYNNENENYSYFKSEYIFIKNATKNRVKILSELDPLDLFEILYIAASKNNFYYKPNLTTSYFTDIYRQIIRNAQNPCDDNRGVITNNFFVYKSLWSVPRLYFTENAVGKLSGVPLISFNNLTKKTCEIQTKYQQTYDMIDSI